MPSLNLDLAYFTHPKAVRLMALLGPDAAVYPIRLWCYTGTYFPEDGELHAHTAQEIETICAWKGEKGHCADALVRFGFIHLTRDGYRIHDWKEHSGHLSVFKKRAKLAAKARWKDACSNASSNAKPPPKQCSNSTVQGSTRHFKTATDSSAAATAPPPEPVVLTFATMGSPKAWALTNRQLQEWRGLYPGLDVLGECRHALAWTKANRPKTYGGMPRFLVTWLNRAANNNRQAPNLFARAAPEPVRTRQD